MENRCKRYQIRPGYVARPFLEECLVIPVGSPREIEPQMAILNEVGHFLWQQLAEKKTLAELVTAVVGE